MQSYNDTIRQNQEAERLLESIIAYENKQHEKEIGELDALNLQHEMRRKRITLITIPLIVMLAAVVLVGLYRRRLDIRATAELKNLEWMRSNFFTNMTHEFRTPLTMILGYSGKLYTKYCEDKAACPDDVEKLKEINDQGNVLLNLVNNILEFSRSESGNNNLKWRRGDMAEFMRAVAEPYEKSAQSKNVNLSVVSYTDELVMNYAPEAIKTVLGNLLSNAIRHTPSGGRIEMFMRPDAQGKLCLFTMRDNGEGIAPENLPRIFELYYTSHAGGMGIGIGLALTKQLVEEMGGTIVVASILGRGTEFTVSLPIVLADIPEEQRADDVTAAPVMDYAAAGATAPGPKDMAGDDRKIVLVVEDNRNMAKYISTVLGDRYAVLHASDGAEGLEMAEKYVPDLIVTDLMMPGKDGYELTADIRASVAVSHIPIIMLTAKATDGDRIEGLKTGVDAYLCKPFNEEELLVRIDKLLESRAKLMKTYSAALLGGTACENAGDDNNKKFFNKLSLAINAHLDDESYFYEGLAADMCLSVSQLYRKVKAMTDDTVFSFVMDARMQRARLLLSKGGQSIKDVAFACGFSDLSYFARSFKHAFGCTPSQYLKTIEQ